MGRLSRRTSTERALCRQRVAILQQVYIEDESKHRQSVQSNLLDSKRFFSRSYSLERVRRQSEGA